MTGRRVVLADDDAALRANLRAIIEAAGHAVVADVADGRACLDAVTITRPDVALVDVRMPLMDGLTAIETLTGRADRPALLVLTTFDDSAAVDRAIAAGVDGFLLKTESPHVLVRAVSEAGNGGIALSPRVARRLADGYHHRQQDSAPAPVERLTEREDQVLQLLSLGHSNAEIGAQLHLTEGTVKGYVSSILNRLGARNRVEAALLRHGVVPAGTDTTIDPLHPR